MKFQAILKSYLFVLYFSLNSGAPTFNNEPLDSLYIIKNVTTVQKREDISCAPNGNVLIITNPGSIVSHTGFNGDPNAGFYQSNQNCLWEIRAPTGFVIRINFVEFAIEFAANCAYDYLNIYDGSTMSRDLLAERLCGHNAPSFTSSGNSVILFFHSDWFVSDRGFHAEFSFEPRQDTTRECGSNLQDPTGFIISHAGYENRNQYPNQYRCKWTITLPVGKQIRLSFEEFNVEYHDQCIYDYLTIFNGPNFNSPMVGKFCGMQLPAPIVSKGNQLYLVFVTDEGVRESGFKLTWATVGGEALHENEIQCDPLSHRSEPQGYIMSTNYSSGGYPPNLACQWLVSVAENAVIQVTFLDFDLENSTHCNLDSVMLFDGPSMTSPLLGMYCGQYASPVRTRRNKLLITFKSDGARSGNGFKLFYQSIYSPLPALQQIFQPATTTTPPRKLSGCGSEQMLYNPQGYLTSKGYGTLHTYEPNSKCEWRIITNPGNVITLSFIVFELEASRGNSSCQYDVLEIYNGPRADGAPAAVYCGSQSTRQFTSDGNELFVVFRSDAYLNMRGFNISYTAHQKHISVSPITTPVASPVNSGCGGPRLRLSPVGFITSHDTVGDGSVYRKQSNCQWLIISEDSSKHIVFRFEIFSLEGQITECTYDILRIYRDGNMNEEGLLYSFCGTLNNYTVVTNSSQLLVTFNSDSTVEMSGFRIRYSMEQNADLPVQQTTTPYPAIPIMVPPVIPSQEITGSGCGSEHNISKMSGVIESINYPRAYSPDVRCQWLFTAPPNKIVSITFEDFNLETHKECDFDKVVVYDGSSTDSPQLGKYCGSMQPGVIRSTGRHMFVWFNSDADTQAKGFRIAFQMADKASVTDPCGVGLRLTDESGTITSPDWGRNYPTNADCQWWIEAPVGKGKTSDPCNFDYLRIFDGASKEDKVIIELCGSALPGIILSSGTRLLLKFHSDGSITRRGFHLQYTMKVQCKSHEFLCNNGDCVGRSFRCNGVNNCRDGSDESGCRMNDDRCGQRNTTPTRFSLKIVGGNAAEPHSWPWQAQVTFNGVHYCGGAIIDPWWIMTAAHCFDDKIDLLKRWNVVAGKHRKHFTDSAEQTRAVRRIFVHNEYNKDGNNYDVALVQLDAPFEFNAEVSHVCVPDEHVPDKHPCYATGWGGTEGTGGEGVLKQVLLPVLEGPVCTNLVVTEQMFCAGFVRGGSDTCQGDSGGPLVCEREDKWYQQGVTSWGIGCADPNSPGVYTKIANMYPWIRRQLNLDFTGSVRAPDGADDTQS